MRIRWRARLNVTVQKNTFLPLLLVLMFSITRSWCLLSSTKVMHSTMMGHQKRVWQPSPAVCLGFEQDKDVKIEQNNVKIDPTDSNTEEDRENDRSADFELEEITERLLNVHGNHPAAARTGEWTLEDFQQLERAMYAWSKRSRANGNLRPAVIQERLLRKVVEEKVAENPNAWDIDMRDMYNAIILSWSRSHEVGAPQRAEEILDAMQYAEDPDLKPTVYTWNLVLRAFAHSKSNSAPQEAMRVLSKLYKLNANGATDVLPNSESFLFILKAHAAVGGLDAADNVLRFLNRMKELSDEGFTSVTPDVKCHNVYLRALIASMDNPKACSSKIARLAEEYLQKMSNDPDPKARPDQWSFNFVLTGLSKCGDADLASRADAIVEQMDQRIHEKSLNRSSIDKFVYNSLIACYAWSQLADKGEKALAVLDKMKCLGRDHPSCLPDNVTYNTVCGCLVKGKDTDAAIKVETLMDELSEEYKKHGDWKMKLTSRSYNVCFDAWAKSNHPEAFKKIMNWIERLEDDFESARSDVVPNKNAYNSYLEALSKHRKPECADEAERILKLLEEKSQRFGGSANMKPDVVTYTNALHCIALSEVEDSFQRAYAILTKMEEGNGDVRPNMYTYNVLINVVAKSKLRNKAKIAVSLIKRMKDVAIRPGTITYNNALNACAYSSTHYEDRKGVLEIAKIIIKEAQKNEGANYITYSTFIRVVRFFVMDHVERWRLIRTTFRQCCDDGQLTTSVMNQIKPGVSKHQYSLLTKEANDPKTGRWKEEYSRNARRLKTQPIQRNNPIHYH